MWKMFKMMFSPAPGWVGEVERNGVAGKAEILSDPQEILKGVGGYEGKDGWIDVEVRVEPAGRDPFEAKMKCKLSQAVFGMMAVGMKVNVKYDGKDSRRVLLVDDVQTLLNSRVRKG